MAAKLGLDATAPLKDWDVERTTLPPQAIEAAAAILAQAGLR
jgi:hypothetical protein